MEPSIVVYPVFILFSFWWWVLVTTVFMWFLVCTANEWFSFGIVPLLLLAIGLTIFGDARFLSLLWSWHILWLIPAYLLTGVGWSMFKWFSFVRNKLISYNERKAAWLKAKGLEDLTCTEQAAKFRDFIKRHTEFWIYDDITPQASKEKNRIIGWMSYWPWSVLWTIFADLIIDLFNNIFRWCRGIFDYITSIAFKIEDF